RSIQRRGRTGRSRAGQVIILVTAGTRDEASLIASERKERMMHKRLHSLKQQWDREKARNRKSNAKNAVTRKGQNVLSDFI
ncbi:MAG: hypothetical protein GX369_01070, partial [Euryarchaeota archaeon]|nr:hypothetical protein [Euryarchaeota archaeon]